MDNLDVLPDRIFDNYYNATIFITGGTGFLGKVIIERLLRLFDVKTIYILIRDKKGQEPSARLQTIFTNPLFDKLHSLKGAEIFEKCKAIAGDVAEDGLGLKIEDREILKKQVEYVIHSAATVRFDEPLRKAILINTKGTVSTIQLAQEMEKLKLFTYVSTAYCHPEQKLLKEIIYPTQFSCEGIVNLTDHFDEDTFESMKNGLMEGIPNTYTFSKALAEDAVANVMDTLPIVIMRPSIVVSMWREPLPGWVDSISGIVGMFIAVGKGAVHSVIGIGELIPDLISVDVVADNILALGAYSVQNGMPTRVFNISSYNYVNESWRALFEKLEQTIKEHVPFDTFLWIPTLTITTSKLLHYFIMILFQLLPALILDRLLPLFGHKPFLWRTQMRILDGLKVMQYYGNNNWIFENDNIAKCEAWMNPKEFRKYTLTNGSTDVKEFLISMVLGTRRYLLNEPDENIPKARRSMKITIWLHRILNIIFKCLMAYLFYRIVLLKIYN